MTFFFFTGTHVVEWLYEKQRSDTISSPLIISYIRIEGTSSGSSDTCLQCPKVSLSPRAIA